MKTHCVNGHDWSTENTGWSTFGGYCRICAKESRDRQAVIWKQRDRQRFFDVVIPVWKACAELTQEGRS